MIPFPLNEKYKILNYFMLASFDFARCLKKNTFKTYSLKQLLDIYVAENHLKNCF